MPEGIPFFPPDVQGTYRGAERQTEPEYGFPWDCKIFG